MSFKTFYLLQRNEYIFIYIRVVVRGRKEVYYVLQYRTITGILLFVSVDAEQTVTFIQSRETDIVKAVGVCVKGEKDLQGVGSYYRSVILVSHGGTFISPN